MNYPLPAILAIAAVMVLFQPFDGIASRSSATPPERSLNRGLSGRLLLSNYEQALALSTGRYESIQQIHDWRRKNVGTINHVGDKSHNWTRFSSNGRFILKVVENCWIKQPFAAIHCVAIFDTATGAIDEFIINPEGHGFGSVESVAISRDGEHAAVFTNDDSASSAGNYYLRIYDKSGNKIDGNSYDKGFGEIGSLEFSPDNRIVFTYGKAILKTPPLSSFGKPLKMFSGNERPIHLRVSPDGKRFVFALKTGGTSVSIQSTLWVLSSDGKRSHKLVEARGYTAENAPQMNNPAWSHDGRWIAFAFGGVSSYDSTNHGFAAGLLAVPSGSVNEPVGYSESEVSPRIVRLQSYYKLKNGKILKSSTLKDSFPTDRVTWVAQ